MRLVLLGPPGAGKGTQARTLAQRLRVPAVASGELFRRHTAENSHLSQLASSYMERGELVPDHVTNAMILERIQEHDCTYGYILDGFPRTLEQAQNLDDALAQRGEILDLALYIRLQEEEELVRRLSGRLMCKKCQTPYHRDSPTPTREGRCDVCGGELYQRPDDAPEAVRKRIQVYHQQTEPLVEYYQRQGKLREIEGQQSIQQVGEDLLAAVSAQESCTPKQPR